LSATSALNLTPSKIQAGARGQRRLS